MGGSFGARGGWRHGGRGQRMGPVSEGLRPYQEFIDAYAQDANAQPDSAPLLQAPAPATAPAPALAPAPQASGKEAAAGAARLQAVRVRLGGQAGTELQGTSLVSALQVDIAFSSDPALPPPTAALVLSSESGQIPVSCSSYPPGLVLHPLPLPLSPRPRIAWV